jgi:hypothetical protein
MLRKELLGIFRVWNKSLRKLFNFYDRYKRKILGNEIVD